MKTSLISFVLITLFVFPAVQAADIPEDVQRSAANIPSTNLSSQTKPAENQSIDQMLDAAELRFKNLAQPAAQLDKDFQQRLNRLIQEIQAYNGHVLERPATTQPAAPEQGAVTSQLPTLSPSPIPPTDAVSSRSSQKISRETLTRLAHQLRICTAQIDGALEASSSDTFVIGDDTAGVINQLLNLTDSINRALVIEVDNRGDSETVQANR